MFHLILLCFSLCLCIRKCYCVLVKIVVHQENCLCSGKDCCVPKSIVVFSKRLLGSSKDCCVSEQELSCVLPVWATVLLRLHDVKLKCNLIKSDFQHIGNFFSSFLFSVK